MNHVARYLALVARADEEIVALDSGIGWETMRGLKLAAGHGILGRAPGRGAPRHQAVDDAGQPAGRGVD